MAHTGMPSKFVWLVTRRYSVLTRRILEGYGKTATIVIDGRKHVGDEVPRLFDEWCTNRMIRRTINFQVIRDGVAIFGFHDSPDDFWAADSERPFIETLVAEKITRYQEPRHLTPREIASRRRGRRGCLVFVAVAALLGVAAWRFLVR